MTSTKTGQPILADLPDIQFRKLVDDDLRGKAEPDIHAALRSKDHVDRWFSVLLAMSKSVEGQLAAKKEDWKETRFSLQSDIDTARRSNKPEVEILKMNTLLQSQREAYQKWRAGTIRFKTGLDEFLAEARHIRDSHRDSMYERVVEDERHWLSGRVRTLETGIRQHRDRILSDTEDDLAHEDADEELWSLIS